MELLIKLFEEHFRTKVHTHESLAKAGSNRQYYRIQDQQGNSAIGVVGESERENRTFIYMAKHFLQKGLPVPMIYAVSPDYKRYLQEDLGKVSLFSALSQGRENGGNYSEEEVALIERTIRLLPHVQIEGADGMDDNMLLPPGRFEKRSVLYDLNYFKYSFLRPYGIGYDEDALQDDFELLASRLTKEKYDYFLYRDFQARNIMLVGEEPYLIDFQGGKRGPLGFDLAAFLWQASARYSPTLREKMIDAYLDELQTIIPVDKETFRQKLSQLILLRLLGVLGAYGLRGLYERKRYFLENIPSAIINLRDLFNSADFSCYPELGNIVQQLSASPLVGIKSESGKADHVSPTQPSLIVRVFSFSYKEGIPSDESGNGGGYVFDCRSSNNPGRYEQYKQLTGLDQPVIDFLEEDGEITTFLSHIYPIADFHVARYIERGFTSLMFSFGCTGGRHRSVYSAQHLAEHIHQKFGVEVRINHTARGITQTLPATKTQKNNPQ